MPDLDNLLQEYLGKLESGMALDAVLADLPEDARTLEPLIRIAAAVREVPHPSPVEQTVQLQRNRIQAAALSSTIPLRRPAPRRRPSRVFWGGTAVFAAASALVVLALVALSAFSLWYFFSSPETARLENVSGQVEFASAEGAGWKLLQAGDRVSAGQRLRTARGANARLVFFEGTTVTILPESEVSFAALGGVGKSLQVELEQTAGETRYKVIPLRGSQSYFRVRTPSGTASVHGTIFQVRITPGGHSQFAVTSGEVRVQNAQAEVALLAGQTTFGGTDGQLTEPGYQFGVQGSLLALDEASGSWNISGMQVQTGPYTVITGSPQLGDMLLVSGRVTPEGLYFADTIQLTDSSDQNAYFTGIIESMQGPSWVVGQNSITVVEDTSISGEMAVGTVVRVTVNILEDGTWLALHIATLEDELPDPEPTEPVQTPIETETATPGPTAVETTSPEETEVPTLTPSPAVDAVDAPQAQDDGCTGAIPHPTGVKLAQRYGVSYDEIMGWFCQHHFGFGEIDLAYNLSHTHDVPVSDIFAMRSSGMGWGEIKKQFQDQNQGSQDEPGRPDKKDKDKKDKKDK